MNELLREKDMLIQLLMENGKNDTQFRENMSFEKSAKSTIGSGRALALIACRECYKVLYTTCSDMLCDLNQGVYEKTFQRRLRKYTLPEVLILDEVGHDRLELEMTKEAHLLFKVINERYNKETPVIITSNVEEAGWGEYLGDPVSAEAIIDRIFHRSIRVEVKGPSYRKHQGGLLQEKYSGDQGNQNDQLL